MTDSARVSSIEALRAFRPALTRFAEESRAAVGASEASARRTLDWLAREQGPAWAREIRRREEEINSLRSEAYRKSAGPGASPRPPADLELRLQKAKRRLSLARQKVDDVRRWGKQLERALEDYRGGVAPLGEFVRGELATASARLDAMGDALDEYAAIDLKPERAAPHADEPGGTDDGGAKP
ncbi:MAG: hypothetical protein AAF356_03195 [Planctomycetota bacterium]